MIEGAAVGGEEKGDELGNVSDCGRIGGCSAFATHLGCLGAPHTQMNFLSKNAKLGLSRLFAILSVNHLRDHAETVTQIFSSPFPTSSSLFIKFHGAFEALRSLVSLLGSVKALRSISCRYQIFGTSLVLQCLSESKDDFASKSEKHSLSHHSSSCSCVTREQRCTSSSI